MVSGLKLTLCLPHDARTAGIGQICTNDSNAKSKHGFQLVSGMLYLEQLEKALDWYDFVAEAKAEQSFAH